MAGKTTRKPPSFEAGLEKLETIAQQMENAELPLEDLMKLYEDGLSLAAELENRLQAARGRMQEVRKGQDGKPEVTESSLQQQMSMIPTQEEEA